MKKYWLALVAVPLVAYAAAATFTWDAPTTYVDATPIGTAPITYNAYIGAKGAEVLTQSGLKTTTLAVNVAPGVEICGQVTAVVNGIESDRSAEGCTTKPFPKPNAPTGFKFN